uniref:Phytochrome n=1 Tax=Pilularia globulifera TaxID=49509 RepID=A0A059UFC8_9MONI|nr:phytochrome [Pilularia globulifera]
MSNPQFSYPTGSSKSKRIAQTSADAKLNAAFEESSDSDAFDYSQSVTAEKEDISSKEVTAYLQRMQRGGLIQPFGCMIAVEEETFRIIAYSENAPEMLDLAAQSVPTVGQYNSTLKIGSDARSLLSPSSAAALQRAASVADVSMFNPVTVQSRNSGRQFYAILHRNDVGLVIDLEPLRQTAASVGGGALQSHKLAAKAISRLQSFPGGDIGLLCDMVVEEVRELTGFDRVMAYKFHEDEHGEVVAEIRRSDLEPYLGLHYPATDIPQAARFLFMKNRVRMIYDCRLSPVKVIQDKKLAQRLSLTGSTLRAPHGCHAQYMANMSSISSLVMAVVVNDSDVDNAGHSHQSVKLWGLVVCHHTGPRYVPFPLRSACEFLMQVFSLQLNMEVGMAAQVKEKHILKTQTLLCDMLLRCAPIGIVSQSPNITDLVKCDGAALYYGKKCWLLGTTPTESQIADISAWLLDQHRDSTGLSTDSLAEAGYPGAFSLGEEVCGMAAAKITSRDFLFWFRSHTAKEIKWGGAKHDPEQKDDGRRMHPRSSFKAFLEVVKLRSLPWDDIEMDAIHSLQLILRGSFHDIDDSDTKIMIHSRLNDLKIQGLDELSTVASEMVRLIETATAPILAVDAQGIVNGWNGKVADITGLPFEKAMGKSFSKELIHEESIETVERVLALALEGTEVQDIEIHLRTYDENRHKGVAILMVNTCSSRDVGNNVVGVCFVGQDVTGQKLVLDRFIRIQGDYKTIVQSPNPLIPPIFGADEFGFCCEWNSAMEKFSSWKREDVLGKMLVGEIFGLQMVCCRLQGQDAMTKLMIVLNDAMNGQESEKFPLVFYDRNGRQVEALLIASKRVDADGKITGVFCFLHTASPELLQALIMKRAKEKVDKELSYLKGDLRKPLEGLTFTRTLLEGTPLNKEQRGILQTNGSCEKQLRKVLDDDLSNIEDGYLDLDTSEFSMGVVADAVISQAVVFSKERGVPIVTQIPDSLKNLYLFGDQARLQQTLANLMFSIIRHTSKTESEDACVGIKVALTKHQLDDGVHLMHVEFRISHSGPGLPNSIVEEMAGTAQKWTPEGLGVSVSRALTKLMNGDIRYIDDLGKKCFVVKMSFPLAQR